ncbi:MAG: hypothetical protein DRI91_02045 [Aquificota bacterium]|nr:MAG: hypothetical protein DRI91_02045 [Aquificota bacterium]
MVSVQLSANTTPVWRVLSLKRCWRLWRRFSVAKGKRSLLKILAAVVGALLVLIVVALLLLPRFINMESVRGKILAQVSQQVRGQVDFHRVDLRLFPSIKVVIHGGRVRIPSTLDVSANTLQVGIRFFPLLRGRVEPTSIAIEEVRGWARLRSGGEGRKGPSLSMEEKVKAFLTLLSSKTPGLKVTLKGANLVLYRGGGEKGLPLSGVEAKISLPPGRLKLSVSMTSSVVSSLKVGGWLEPEDLKGELDVDLGGFQLHKLLHWLSLSFPREPTDSLVNLSVSMEFQGLREVKGRLKGSVPRLLLKGQKGIPAIECRSFNAGFSKIGSAWQVILKELALAYPGIRLSGRFFMDSAGESVSLTLKGESVDVSSVRKVALFLAGSHSTVEKIFHIVRAGEVPSIIFEDRASSPKDLGKLESMVIRGSIRNGIIVVPKELLTIKDVGGRVFTPRASSMERVWWVAWVTQDSVGHLETGFKGQRLSSSSGSRCGCRPVPASRYFEASPEGWSSSLRDQPDEGCEGSGPGKAGFG